MNGSFAAPSGLSRVRPSTRDHNPSRSDGPIAPGTPTASDRAGTAERVDERHRGDGVRSSRARSSSAPARDTARCHYRPGHRSPIPPTLPAACRPFFTTSATEFGHGPSDPARDRRAHQGTLWAAPGGDGGATVRGLHCRRWRLLGAGATAPLAPRKQLERRRPAIHRRHGAAPSRGEACAEALALPVRCLSIDDGDDKPPPIVRCIVGLHASPCAGTGPS